MAAVRANLKFVMAFFSIAWQGTISAIVASKLFASFAERLIPRAADMGMPFRPHD
jgi:hypothetical protein